MYKKLQRKFLWGSTLVLLLVIGAVVMGVYGISSSLAFTQTEVLMQLILDNGGELPEHSEFNANQEAFLALNGESIYETRFFSALDGDDGVEIVSMHIAAIGMDTAVELTERAVDRDRDAGRITAPGRRILHYARREMDDGEALFVFLDSTSRYGLMRLVVTYMAALWFTVLVLYIIVMARLSGKLVQPFIENDERQKRFITNASHELKTPLAVISANTEMTELLGGESKWTQSTRRQVARLQELIEDLVVLARLDEMQEAAAADVDLTALIGEVAEPFRALAESAGATLRTELAPNVRLCGDRRALQQVASILLENAVKYCDPGGAITVALTPKARGKGARLSVSNTYAAGKGVDTSRFFERFYRQDESHSSGKSGFGIGLSMCREIVERMKGSLTVRYAGDTITFIAEL